MCPSPLCRLPPQYNDVACSSACLAIELYISMAEVGFHRRYRWHKLWTTDACSTGQHSLHSSTTFEASKSKDEASLRTLMHSRVDHGTNGVASRQDDLLILRIDYRSRTAHPREEQRQASHGSQAAGVAMDVISTRFVVAGAGLMLDLGRQALTQALGSPYDRAALQAT
jgi:hypothetical protein